jgi:hypothetical protein
MYTVLIGSALLQLLLRAQLQDSSIKDGCESVSLAG